MAHSEPQPKLPVWDDRTPDIDERCPHCDSRMWVSTGEETPDGVVSCRCLWCGGEFQFQSMWYGKR